METSDPTTSSIIPTDSTPSLIMPIDPTPSLITPSDSTPSSSTQVNIGQPCEKKSKLVPEVKPLKSSKLTKPKTTTRRTPLVAVSKGSKRKDLEKRDAYKSLFTSTTPARSKEQSSHWVTFFPYH